MARRADQEIGKVTPCFAGFPIEIASEEEIAVRDVINEVFFELVVVKLTSELERVGADDFAVVVQDLVDVVDQTVRTARHSDHKVVEVDFRNTFESGNQRENTGSPVCAGSESETGEGYSFSTEGWLNWVSRRKYPIRNSFTDEELIVLVSPRVIL